VSKFLLLLPFLSACVTSASVEKYIPQTGDLVTLVHPFFKGLCCELTGINTRTSPVLYDMSCTDTTKASASDTDFIKGCSK